jgi:hypothetical protein
MKVALGRGALGTMMVFNRLKATPMTAEVRDLQVRDLHRRTSRG